MLLSNIEPPELFNGMRLVITKIGIRILATSIWGGPFAGTTKLLTPMKRCPSDVPFEFTQRQFLIKICFAFFFTSFNKAQR